MSFSDSAAANAANPHGTAQDAQKLIALLGNLMPLLLRIQAQGGEAFGPFAQPNLMLDNPLIDQQAATNLVEDITAESLRTLSAYLDIYASRFPGLDNCVTIVTQAAHRLKARDYAQAFELIWQVYRIITAATHGPQGSRRLLPRKGDGSPRRTNRATSSCASGRDTFHYLCPCSGDRPHPIATALALRRCGRYRA
jgi:hypothetical protein